MNAKNKKKCTINDRYLFIWDKRLIQYYDLTRDMTTKEMIEVNFSISRQQKNVEIEKIICGSNEKIVAIIVK